MPHDPRLVQAREDARRAELHLRAALNACERLAAEYREGRARHAIDEADVAMAEALAERARAWLESGPQDIWRE